MPKFVGVGIELLQIHAGMSTPVQRRQVDNDWLGDATVFRATFAQVVVALRHDPTMLVTVALDTTDTGSRRALAKRWWRWFLPRAAAAAPWATASMRRRAGL